MTDLSDEGAELIREYARENMRMCTDSIMNDPLLQGGLATMENKDRSEKMRDHGTIHSARYHAAKDILELFGKDTSDL